MTRVKVSFTIILLIILGSLFSMLTIQHKYRHLENMLIETEKLMEADKSQEALAKAEQITAYWDRLHKISAFLVRNDKILNIHSSIAKIKPFIEDDCEEVYGEFESIKEMIRWLYESEIPYVYNVF